MAFTLERTTVQSKSPPAIADTLEGTADVGDFDGLDSVWITVDSVVAGEDAGFDQHFFTRFRFAIRAGRVPSTRIPVQIRARDIAGFEAKRDTYVVVVP